MQRMMHSPDTVHPTPGAAVAYGAIAGAMGTAVLSLLSHLFPRWGASTDDRGTALPKDAFDERQITEWQDRMRSPAAYQSGPRESNWHESRGADVASITPAGALAESEGPGPEGAAEQFALKLGSGLFNRDWSQSAKPAGKAVHFAYGSSWGVVYGALQGNSSRNPWTSGAVHGLSVWAFGPGLLVPAMRLMLPPAKAPKRQTLLMIAGHLVYGITVAKVYDMQVRRRT